MSYTSCMNIKDLVPGKTRVMIRNTAAPLGSDGYDHGLVTKVGRKYVTVALDRPVYGGSCAKLLGGFTTETQVLADVLLPEGN